MPELHPTYQETCDFVLTAEKESDYVESIMAGTTVEGRVNRAQLWQALCKVPRFTRTPADKTKGHCELTLRVAGTPAVIPQGFCAMARFIDKCDIKEVRVAGKEVGPDHYMIWQDSCSKFVKVDCRIPVVKGDYTVDIIYDKPFSAPEGASC